MVKLQALSLTNFMTIEQLDLQFDSKTVVMIGGQNGGGKSTILYAIALALFEHKKGDSYKDYVRVGASHATIHLDALYNGFPIVYDLKISTAKYGVPLTRTISYRGKIYNNSECRLLLDELDSAYLEHAMFLLQNDTSIVDLRPSERAKLLKKVLHFEFDEQVATLKGRIEQETQLHATLSIRLEEMQKKTFKDVELLSEKDASQLPTLRARLEELVKQLAGLTEFDALEFSATERQLAAAKQSLMNHEASLQKSRRLLDEKLQKIDTLQQVTLVDVAAVDPASLADAETALLQANGKVSTASMDLRVAKEACTTLEKQLVISEKGVCHSCGHEIEASHVQKLRDELAAKQVQLKDIKRSHAELQKSAQEASAHYEALKRSQLAWEQNESLKRSNATSLAALTESCQQLRTLLEAQESTVQSSASSVALLQQKRESLEEAHQAGNARAELLREKASIEQKLTTIADALVVNAERRRRNEELAVERSQHKEALRQLAKQVNISAQNIDLLKKSLAVFEVDFPNFIILRTCARLEGYINNFIQKLFPYMAVRLQPSRSGVEFYYTAAASEEEWLSVKMASGAQAAVLTLAWRVAIARLYGMSAILLDEVDASATEDNAALIYQFIASLDVFDQIIFVSHKTEAMKAISTLMDNVVCYYVQGGEYTLVDDPTSMR